MPLDIDREMILKIGAARIKMNKLGQLFTQLDELETIKKILSAETVIIGNTDPLSMDGNLGLRKGLPGALANDFLMLVTTRIHTLKGEIIQLSSQLERV